MKQYPIAFTDSQYNQLKKRAEQSGCSIASIVRTILTDNFFDKE